MKKLAILSLILLLPITFLFAETNNFLDKDFWESKDKQEHFGGSFVLSSVIVPELYKSLSETKPTKTEVFLISVGSTMLIGWAKEVRDGQGYGNKDINDLDADVLGALLGAFVNITIRW